MEDAISFDMEQQLLNMRVSLASAKKGGASKREVKRSKSSRTSVTKAASLKREFLTWKMRMLKYEGREPGSMKEVATAYQSVATAQKHNADLQLGVKNLLETLSQQQASLQDSSECLALASVILPEQPRFRLNGKQCFQSAVPHAACKRRRMQDTPVPTMMDTGSNEASTSQPGSVALEESLRRYLPSLMSKGIHAYTDLDREAARLVAEGFQAAANGTTKEILQQRREAGRKQLSQPEVGDVSYAVISPIPRPLALASHVKREKES